MQTDNKVKRDTRLLIVMVLVWVLLVIGFIYVRSNWGIRRSIRRHDYKVLKTILTDPLPESFVIKRVYVEFYLRGGIPAQDVFPYNYDAIYEVEISEDHLNEMLDHIEYNEHAVDETLSLLDSKSVRRHFDIGEIERYLTCSSGPALNHLFISKHKNRLRLYIRTYGVDEPGFWHSISDNTNQSMSKYDQNFGDSHLYIADGAPVDGGPNLYR